MNILNEVVDSAVKQFGREFGRAGANLVLKGKNSYVISVSSDYSERIKPSDSDIVRSIKEINKVKFVTMNKANVSRLIEITDLIISKIEFRNNQTLNELSDVIELINQYNEKFNHGSSLIDDDFKEKSVEYLQERRSLLLYKMNNFNQDIRSHIIENLELAIRNRKSKKTAVLLSLPLVGLQWFYLKSPGYAVLSILFCWTIILPMINLFSLLKMVFSSESKFDAEYNPDYVYFSQFNV